MSTHNITRTLNVNVVKKKDEITSVKFGDETKTDAFGRFRVSEPFNIFDANFIADENDVQFSKLVTGVGSITREETRMILEINNGSCVIRSRQRGIYQSGKSLLILITGVLDYDNNDLSTVSKIGYYDDDDGFYFQYTTDTLSVVKRSSSSGVLVETVNNLSNHGLDLTKTLIFFFDLEWLGMGQVRTGVVVGGEFKILYKFQHSNKESLPYINLASLNATCEISGNSTGKCLFNCVSISSEGGFNPVGKLFSIDNHITPKTVGATLIPLLALRIKADSKINVYLEKFSIVATSNNSNVHFEIFLVRDPVGTELTNVSWTNVHPDSHCEYDASSTALSGTFNKILGGYQGQNSGFTEFQSNQYNNITLGKNILGNSDILILACVSLSGTENIVGNIIFKEIL